MCFCFTVLKMEWKIKCLLSMTNMFWSFYIMLFNKLTMSFFNFLLNFIPMELFAFFISSFFLVFLNINTIAHFPINKLRPYTGGGGREHHLPVANFFRVANLEWRIGKKESNDFVKTYKTFCCSCIRFICYMHTYGYGLLLLLLILSLLLLLFVYISYLLITITWDSFIEKCLLPPFN